MHYLVNKAVGVIVQLYAPDEIILFGSHAKGKETDLSDIDLLIIKPSFLPREKRGVEVKDYLKKYSKKFDLLFYTPREISEMEREPFSFIKSILNSGISIYKNLENK